MAFPRLLVVLSALAFASLLAADEPARLVAGADPAQVDGKTYDLVVVGGTGSGVMCAVRAAREGLRVLLTQHDGHLGGMMTNGLMQWDALYGGARSALFTELLWRIEDHYRKTYGADSKDFKTIHYTHQHYPTGWAEPHIAEREFDRLIAGEKGITVLLNHYPTAVERSGATLEALRLQESHGSRTINVHATVFADATYEGDLLPLAKVAYRVGREGRDEYGEPHAGKVFTNIDRGAAPLDAVEGRLNIHPYISKQGTIDPTSPFTADGEVQAYNFRFCVTKDPANRLLLTEPPPSYNREEFLHFDRKSIATNPGPNLKSHMNSPILPGENRDYPEADWPTREKITRRHRDFALGLIWFLQNDESVSEKARAGFREWGLPKDEFVDHDHIPYEMYVREARRLVGRHVMTENQGMLAPGLARTVIQPDGIATTDWYMDSHSCTNDSRPGFKYDGKLILTEESRPTQIPYRAMLPREVDNLLVPVCLSATHVAWGAVRLEPVWMQTGEAAGLAAALSVRGQTVPGKLDADQLVRSLVERHQLISFFNDVDVASDDAAMAAVEYFGTKGFFASYDARPTMQLSMEVARAWTDGFRQLREGKFDASALAHAVAAAEQSSPSGSVTAGAFASSLGSAAQALPGQPPLDPAWPISRADACRLMFNVLKAAH